MSDSRVEQTNGGTVLTGEATEIFRLAAIISSLRLEMLGIKTWRGISALAVAKRFTKLTTRDRTKHIAKLEEMLRDVQSRTEYVDTRTTS